MTFIGKFTDIRSMNKATISADIVSSTALNVKQRLFLEKAYCLSNTKNNINYLMICTYWENGDIKKVKDSLFV